MLNISTLKIIGKVRKDNLTYLNKKALYALADSVKKASASKRKGIIIEAGCALGGSGIVCYG